MTKKFDENVQTNQDWLEATEGDTILAYIPSKSGGAKSSGDTFTEDDFMRALRKASQPLSPKSGEGTDQT